MPVYLSAIDISILCLGYCLRSHSYDHLADSDSAEDYGPCQHVIEVQRRSCLELEVNDQVLVRP